MVSPSAFRARQLRYCLLMGPSPNLPPGSYSPPAARASSPSAGGAGNAQRSRSMTTPQHLRGGLYHHAGKRANSSSLSARTPALFSSSSTRTYTCLPPTTRCRLCREVCLLRAFGVRCWSFWSTHSRSGFAAACTDRLLFRGRSVNRADQEDEL